MHPGSSSDQIDMLVKLLSTSEKVRDQDIRRPRHWSGHLDPSGHKVTLLGEGFLVIYGNDSRYDVVAIHDLKRQEAVLESARSVAAVFSTLCLKPAGERVDIVSERAGKKFNFVPGARFGMQRTAATATAFVVGEQHMLTAGHAITMENCNERRFVFGYRVDERGETCLQVPSEWVYKPVEVQGVADTQGADWALVKVDRKIDRPPLRRRTRPVKKGEAVYYVGYPWGLPLKYAGQAVVMDATPQAYFKANLDTFTGASGSPVFDDNNEVVGVHVRGIEQTVFDRSKKAWAERRVRSGTGDAMGQEVTRITAIPLDGV